MNKTYIPAIDGMRAMAIGIVIAAHFGADRFIPGGFGVTLFFFISGYLITGLLIQEQNATGKIAISSFYMRRFLRLGPALMTMIFAVSSIYYMLIGPVSAGQILAGLLYYTNYYGIFGGYTPVPLGPLWSLAVEEHYYLIFPLIFAVTWRHGERLLVGLAALTVAILIWRIVLVVGWNAPEFRTYYATDTRIDSILWGAILAVMLKTRFADYAYYFERWTVVVTAALLLLFTFLYRDPIFRETLRYSLQSIAILPLFYVILFVDRFSLARAALEFAPLVWIGRLSYSLYLYHFAVLFFMAKVLPEANFLLLIFIDLLATLAAASFSYYCIERPFRKLRERFRGRSAKHHPVQNNLTGSPAMTELQPLPKTPS